MDKDKLKQYRVHGTMTISVYVDVTAKTEQEALDIAEGAPVVRLCHQCATGSPEEWSTSGELDGVPEIAEVEEIDE
jgi:hypothetical protein